MDLFLEIEKNFPKIEKFFTEKLLSEFIETAPEDLEKFNVGLGTMIRLRLLRPKSALYKKFIQHSYTDTNAMTMVIIREFYTYTRNKYK